MSNKQLDLTLFMETHEQVRFQCFQCKQMKPLRDLVIGFRLAYTNVYFCKTCEKLYRDSLFQDVNKEYLETEEMD